jgi:hypothetical protein
VTVVAVPIRLRVDPATLDRHALEVERAFAAAVGRALATADGEVGASRRRTPPTLHRPTFTWRGEAAGGVDGPAREAVEASLRARLDDVIDAVFAAGREATADAGRPGLLDRPQREPFDRSRHDKRLGVYLVPGYDGAGRPVAVVVTEVEATADAAGVLRPAWAIMHSNEEALEALRAIVSASGAVPTGPVGAICRGSDGALWIGSADLAAGRWRSLDPVLGLERFVVQEGPRGPVLRSQPAFLPPTARYRLQPAGPATTVAERIAILEEVLGPAWRDQLRRQADASALGLEQDELDTLIERAVTSLARERAESRQSAGIRSYELLLVDGDPWLLGSGTDYHDLEDMDLIPLTEEMLGFAGTGAGLGTDAPRAPRPAGGGPRPTLEVLEGQPSSGGADVLSCDPIEGEPSFDELGEAGERLRRALGEVAATLRTTICPYPGATCRRLAQVAAARAAAISRVSVNEPATTQAREPGTGEFGALDATMVVSPAIIGLRELAGATARLDTLVDATATLVGERDDLLPRPYRDRGVSWKLRLYIAMRPVLDDAVAWIFVAACRTAMLQVLRASHRELRARLDNFTAYAPFAEHAVTALVTELDHLENLQRTLAREAGGTGVAVGQTVISTWRGARQSVLQLLDGELPRGGYDPGAPGSIDRDDTGRPIAIHDRHGRRWTPENLVSAIEIGRGTATSIDPLLQQLTEVDKARFQQQPTRIRATLRAVLEEMVRANEAVTGDCEADAWYAFRAGSFTEVDLRRERPTVPYSGVLLTGIHLHAHQAVGTFFRGAGVYGVGLDRIFGVELGKRSLRTFFEFTGTIALAILCPPAAVAVGVGLAGIHQAEAGAAVQRTRAALDPNAFRDRAEVEIEQFAAELGLALSFLPVAGTAARAGAVAVRSAGSRYGAQLFVRWARGAVTASMRQSLRHGVAVALVRELATDQIMDKVLGTYVLGPAIAELQREFGPPAVAEALARVPEASGAAP